MPVEIEAKLKVDALGPVREQLKSLQAVSEGDVLETNVFFDTKDRSLLAADKGLRVRRAIAGGKEKFKITFKGPRQQGAFKSREEIEFSVGDGEQALELFKGLGYVQIFSFEKRRESWRLGQCLVELDELPVLGFFVEIEGPDDEAVESARQQLGLREQPVMKSSYVALLMGHLQERGDGLRVVRFDGASR